MRMRLIEIVDDIADALADIDSSRQAFRNFQSGVGPYGEPQLVKLIAKYINGIPKYEGAAVTKRCPDLLIPEEWALEFKITRPFGDNGSEAENWSVNLLHPYSGNVSTVGDCLKLLDLDCQEKLGVVVIGYEHSPPKINLSPLVTAFELIARHVVGVNLSQRIETKRENLVHPVHQTVRVFAWEVLHVT